MATHIACTGGAIQAKAVQVEWQEWDNNGNTAGYPYTWSQFTVTQQVCGITLKQQQGFYYVMIFFYIIYYIYIE